MHQSNTHIHTASYLANEPRDKQEHQYAVVVSTVTEEGVWHEGGEEGYLSVRLSHFHFPQLHLNGLQTQIMFLSRRDNKQV